MKRNALVLVASIAAIGFAQSATAGTLEKVQESGSITMGIRESSKPLSYLDGDQKPIGYHIDICNGIVEAVKVKLKLKTLKVVHQPVTSQNRIRWLPMARWLKSAVQPPTTLLVKTRWHLHRRLSSRTCAWRSRSHRASRACLNLAASRLRPRPALPRCN